MRWEQVFVSYDGKDKPLVTRIAESMARVGMEPFLAPYHTSVGSELSYKIMKAIADSNCFVPILTRNSISNQWVNQEIGYAFARRESVCICPLVERSLEIKGFIHRSRENIEIDLDDVDSAIYRLISALRAYVNRNFETIKKIYVTCPKCENRYSIPLPSQDEIDEAVREERIIPTRCRACKMQNNLSPKTFEVKESIRTMRRKEETSGEN